MNVLIFAKIEPTGGTGTYFKRLLSFLNEQNIPFKAIIDKDLIANKHVTNGVQSECFIPYIQNTSIESIFYKVFRKIKLEWLYLILRDSILLKYHLCKNKSDLVIVSQAGGESFFPIFRSRKNVLFIIHSLKTKTPFTENKFTSFFFLSKNASYHKTIIHMSNFACNQFIKYMPFTKYIPKNISLPNYADNFPLHRPIPEQINILTVGHLQDYKNPLLWFDVATDITRKYNNVYFTWVGSGDLYQELKTKAKDNNQIILTGYTNNVASYYHTCDIYFHPSKTESQGLTVIDAMSSSIPCVVSNAGGLPESVEDGFNGYTCNSYDKLKFEEKLEYLIVNKSERERMGNNSRLLYEKNFSQEEWEERMLNLLIKHSSSESKAINIC